MINGGIILMHKLFVHTARVLEDTVHRINGHIPPPEFVQLGKHQVFRYRQRSLEIATVQKLTRIVSGLFASLALLRAGLYQELGVMFRVLDELVEDVIFLCQPLRDGNVTALHNEYLESFFQEEFVSPDNPMASEQKRPTISRKMIHAALARIPDSPVNPSDAAALHRTLSQTLSGFVHSASVHVLEMYGGSPPHYHMSGMRGTPRQIEYERGAAQYFYRGLVAVMYVAGCFKDKELTENLYKFRAHFEGVSGMTEWHDPDRAIRRLRKGDT